MERMPHVRRLSWSDVPMQQPRRSSLADAPRCSVGNRPRPPMVPLEPSRLADTCTSCASASQDASGRLTSTTHLAVASSSSVPGGKMPHLGENSGCTHPLESRPLQPQSTSRSGGGDMPRQPLSEDNLYDADASSGDHSDLADRRKLSSVSARIKCCDVYIGMCGHGDPLLLRFVNWLRAELQLHGVMCFVSDRNACTDAHAHCVAREAIDSATLGLAVITTKTFSSPYGMEELKLFLERRNLVAAFFGITQEECLARDIIEKRGELWQEEGGLLWELYGGLEEEWKEAVNGLSFLDCRLEARTNNWRDCILDAVVLVGRKLGRNGIVGKVKKWKETVAGTEFPFPRNDSFVGREKELLELELVLFGYVEEDEHPEMRSRRSFGRTLITVNNGGRRSLDLKGKEKEPLEERELEGRHVERLDCLLRGGKSSGQTPTTSPANGSYDGKGIACVCGESGIGKTELVLEFTYRFAQRYKMVLWIGGEARYLRQNYLNLLPILGIELQSSDIFEGWRLKGSEELEEKAMYRVRKELMRDIPYLVVIDNLEGEKDWWDERNLMELFPPFGGETHIIISTRLPHVMDLEPMGLLYLSAAEALALMKGGLEDLSREEISALKVIEVRIGRIPLGLAIVRGILSEVNIKPTKLLDAITHMPYRNLTWSGSQDPILRHNRGMVQLLDLCFAILDLGGRHGNLASRMVQACGWFAPSPVPGRLLVAVASSSLLPQECGSDNIWKRLVDAVPCVHMSRYKQLEAKAMDMLVRFHMARGSTKKNGFIHFHDVIRLFARKIGNPGVAHSMVQAISHYGSLHHHSEHIWAASFLLFNFGTDPAVVNLEFPELLFFIKKCILPLAWDTSTIFFRYGAALELLHHAMKALEAVKPPQPSEARTLEKAPRRRISMQSESHVYVEFSALEATLLETISKLMRAGPSKNL